MIRPVVIHYVSMIKCYLAVSSYQAALKSHNIINQPNFPTLKNDADTYKCLNMKQTINRCCSLSAAL